MRVTRNKFLEEYHAQWIMVIRSKGLSETQVLLRILKVCLPTILNVVAIQLSVVIAGTMITETIFDIPGMGSLLFEGIQNRDYPIVQGVIVYSTMMYMAIYFALEYINEQIDPRIKAND
jgi:peptide/nickel transport system permease protein